MSEINANIVVQQIGANIVVEQNNINITPEDIQLRVFAGGYATPSGNIYEVQYNSGGVLAGNPGLKYFPANTTTVANNLTVSNNSSLGQATAGNLYANTGTVGASLLTGTLTTASQPNITSLGTLTGLTVNGNVTANYFLGNGSQLTGIDATQIINGNSNVVVSANSNITVSVAGNSNIVTVTGTGVNIAGYLNTTGNIAFSGANVSVGSASNLKITGGNNGYFLQTDGTGNLTWAVGGGNVSGNGVPGGANTQIQFNNAGNFGGAAGFTFDTSSNAFNAPGNGNFVGNVSAAYFIGNGSQLTGIDATLIANGSANVRAFANANVTVSAGGVPNVLTVTTNSVLVDGNIYANTSTIGASLLAGTLTTAAQPNVTSIGTLSNLTVTSNITGGNLIATGIFSGNGNGLTNLNAANLSTGTISSARLSGTYGISITGTAGSAGTVTANAQPNITSVGTLTSLTVSGNISGNGRLLTSLNASNIDTGTLAQARLANSTITLGNTTLTLGATTTTVTGLTSITATTFNGNISGTANTVSNAAQPNITSLGTLTTLAINNTKISLGSNSSAGNFSVSIGNGAVSNSNAVAIGSNSNATSNGSISIGNNAISSDRSVAVGALTNANGVFSVALGYGADALNTSAVAIGDGSNAAGIYSIAIGLSSTSNGDSSISMGKNSKALQNSSIAIGNLVQANGGNSIAIGSNVNWAGSTDNNFIGIGTEISNIGTNAIAVGSNITNPNAQSINMGLNIANTATRTIVLNATNAGITGALADRLYIKPVRTVNSIVGLNQLYYDSTTGEIVVYVP
jgi:hypothetical protein